MVIELGRLRHGQSQMRSLVIAAVIFGATWNAAGADDPASILARILVQKGTINSAELARVESAAMPDKVAVLASILADKGVLSADDLARVRSVGSIERAAAPAPKQAASAPPVPALFTTPNPPPQPPAPPKVKDGPAVVADSKTNISVYGTILLNAFSNSSLVNILDVPLFAGKQGSGLPGDDKTFGMMARQTRLGLKLLARDVAGAKTSGQVEFDFFGGKAAFTNGINMDLVRLRLAYGRLDWNHWAFETGQDWSVFAPLNPTTYAEYAIPGLSASGNLWIRSPQIRGEYHGPVFGEGAEFKWQFGVVDPNMGDFNTTVFTSGRNPDIGSRGRFPGGEQRLGLVFGDDHKYGIGVSTHYARGKNNGTVGTLVLQNPVDSWGVALDYSLSFAKRFNFSGEWFEGRALGIFSDASGESILPVGTPGAHGVESRGGWSQAQFNFLKRWQTNLGYGIDAEVNSNLRVGDRNKNQTYFGNIMFKYNPHLTVALEYRRLLTNWKAQPFYDEQGNHFNLAIAYFF